MAANMKLLRRLEHVARTMPRKEFNMEKWQCGTTRCWAGWATQDPVFQKAGLRMHSTCIPKTQKHAGYDALRDVLGITRAEVFDLFCPSAYPSYRPLLRSLLARLRQVMANYDSKGKRVVKP